MAAARQPDLLAVEGPQEARLTLPDGVDLVADIYRPAGAGPWPVLLMRQPYGRRIASTVVLAHPRWYAAHGYVVVIQDVRGTGGSGGRHDPLRQEIADGAATIDWARGLPGSDGKVGLYGFSYQATAQYLAIAGGGLPDAIAPAMGSWSPRSDWATESGLFRLALNTGWAVQMARLQARRQGDGVALAALADSDPARLRAFLLGRPDLGHLADWIADDPGYWAAISPSALLAGRLPGVPALHVGGLNDFLLRGTLAADAAFRAVSAATSHLVLGPWAHMPWNRAAGAAQAGPGAELSVDRQHLAFFDHYLKGLGPRPAPILAYDAGRECWNRLDDWPAPETAALHLSSGGLAAALLSDGILGPGPAAGGADFVVHDPDHPAPLIGGPLGMPNGFADRAAADNRGDVAVYTSAPLESPLCLVGPARLWLRAGADSPAFDLCATLSRVAADGSARVMGTGILRATAEGDHDIDLGTLSATLPAGERLRLSVQGAAAPAFGPVPDVLPPTNPEHAAPSAGAIGPVITLVLHHRGSRLELPVVRLPEVLPHA